MTKPDATSSNRLMWVFLAFVLLVIVGIAAGIIFVPFESGTLVPTSDSGNLSFGGYLGVRNDLIYYRTPDGSLAMKDAQTGSVTAVCDGDCSYLNVGEEWVYFIRNGDIVRVPLGNVVEPQVIVGGEERCRGLSVQRALDLLYRRTGAHVQAAHRRQQKDLS